MLDHRWERVALHIPEEVDAIGNATADSVRADDSVVGIDADENGGGVPVRSHAPAIVLEVGHGGDAIAARRDVHAASQSNLNDVSASSRESTSASLL
jgi:hypothetical protein